MIVSRQRLFPLCVALCAALAASPGVSCAALAEAHDAPATAPSDRSNGLSSQQAISLPATSLFFTAEEVQAIKASETATPYEVDHAQANDGMPRTIYLDAVMYYGPEDWTLWLQGERWTPHTRRSGLDVVSVLPSGDVRLSLQDTPNAAPRVITLRAHQAYNFATGKISEGSTVR